MTMVAAASAAARSGNGATAMDKKAQYNAWYFVAAIFGILLLQLFYAQSQKVDVVPYSQFQSDLKAGKIADVRVSNNYVQGTYKAPDKSGKTEFVTTRIDAPELIAELDKYGVTFSGQIESHFLGGLLSWGLPVVLFFGLWIFVVRRFADKAGFGGGGLMAIGKS